MIDILITTYNRMNFLKETIRSLFEKTKIDFRLFIHDDHSTDGTVNYLLGIEHKKLYLSLNRNGEAGHRGVVPAFNRLWNDVDYDDLFWEERPYMCYLQDDALILEDDWLTTLIHCYEEIKEQFDIGFFSGYDAPEHPTREKIIWRGREILIKDSQTATNLIASKEFWRSVGWIPRRNPDGSERGFPHKNRGSHIDIYLTGCQSGSRFVSHGAGKNCSYLQRKKILVIPMIKHLGNDGRKSTWREDG